MIYVYNPTCEMAVQNSTVNYQPPRNLMAFERMLAPLMMFVASDGDYVVADKPHDDILRLWLDRGAPSVSFVTLDVARQLVSSGHPFRPWGMSREVMFRLGGRQLASQWTDAHRRLFSRLSSVALDDALASCCAVGYCQQTCRPRVLTTESELHDALLQPCVLKTLWSASGRGVSIVNQDEFRPAAFTRFAGALRRDGAVVCEPVLSRLVDFAFLFWLHADGRVDYLGTNFYESDPAGRFGKELIGRNPMQPFVADGHLPLSWEEDCSSTLSRAISSMGWHTLYSGPIGVDAMAYDDAGRVMIRLCIEANIRYTMGNVNLGIRRCLPPDMDAEWSLSAGSPYVVSALRSLPLPIFSPR